MEIVIATKKKINAVLDRIVALQAGEFPHEHSAAALTAIEAIFVDSLQLIESLSPGSDPATVRTHCNVVAQAMETYLPLLGFLHRSKNATNAFELYGPMLRLASQLIAPSARLILSSEWDFSPYTYVSIPDLPEFVWVGLPASESSNALLSPLAGHEFGHSMWLVRDLAKTFEPKINSAIVAAITNDWSTYQHFFPAVPNPAALTTDLFGTRSWRQSHDWALSQTEELFCDLVGLRVFGTAYLYAFAYLLAPGEAVRSVGSYPTLPQRVAFMKAACQSWGLNLPPTFEPLFQPVADPTPSKEAFLLRMADEATSLSLQVLQQTSIASLLRQASQ